MRTFDIKRNPNDCGVLYLHKNLTFQPGVTVLVGCNGCGKTSLINQIANSLKKENIAYVKFDNLSDGGSNARSKAGFYGDFSFLATSLCSSEGENIVMNMANVAKELGYLSKNNKSNELWLLLDGVDSGLSIDNIIELKDYLFKVVIEHEASLGREVYIIVTANEYEMARGEKCFDTWRCKYIEFQSYEDYRDFILKSKIRKEKRESKNQTRKKEK